MVRAAAAGVIDYTKADPRDKRWRIKHLLLLTEIERKDDYALLSAAQQHWLALLSHGRLTEESFESVKKNAADILEKMKTLVFPWLGDVVKEAPKNDTIIDADPETQRLIERYKKMRTNPD